MGVIKFSFLQTKKNNKQYSIVVSSQQRADNSQTKNLKELNLFLSHSRNWRYEERVLKMQSDTFFQTVFVSTFVYAYQQSGSLLKEVYLLYFVKKN